jgi:hypothetical protein
MIAAPLIFPDQTEGSAEHEFKSQTRTGLMKIDSKKGAQ